MDEGKRFFLKSGHNYNLPTQKSMELGLFEIHKRIIEFDNGPNKVTSTIKVTGKGQVYFISKFLEKKLEGDSMKMGYFTNPSGDFSSVGQAVNFINDLYEKERHATNSINSVEFSMGNETDAKAVAYLEDLFKKSPLEPYAK